MLGLKLNHVSKGATGVQEHNLAVPAISTHIDGRNDIFLPTVSLDKDDFAVRVLFKLADGIPKIQ